MISSRSALKTPDFINQFIDFSGLGVDTVLSQENNEWIRSAPVNDCGPFRLRYDFSKSSWSGQVVSRMRLALNSKLLNMDWEPNPGCYLSEHHDLACTEAAYYSHKQYGIPQVGLKLQPSSVFLSHSCRRLTPQCFHWWPEIVLASLCPPPRLLSTKPGRNKECPRRQNETVDSQVLQTMRDFQDALIPLPDYVINFMISTSASLYLPIRADPGLCHSHSQYTLHSVLNSEVWAIRMIDAASKLHPGVLDGRIQNLGNYDQCLNIEEPEQRFTGQHCLVDAHGLLPNHLNSYFRSMASAYVFPGGYLSFSLCVPSSCDPQDIITHLDRILEMAGLNVSMEKFEIFCSTREPHQFRGKDWFAMGVCTTIWILVILSTWYESRTRTSGTGSDLLSSFSMISNWRELKDTSISPSDISCLNGLRVIFAFFVMVTHRFIVGSMVPVFNFTSYLEMRSNPWMAFLWSTNLAAEIFFLIAGIVRAYSFLRSRRAGKQISIFKQYIQRYFRVTPTLAIVVLSLSTIGTHLSGGPMYNKYTYFIDRLCSYTWWAHLLHISNCVGFPLLVSFVVE
ncbi:hypothetical protein J6590_048320 [Homalodisca vitripennis]|nr:hypothetical protein J6590_048320 [Homalodisca vitripennis]